MAEVPDDINEILDVGEGAAVGAIGQNPDKAAEAVKLSGMTGVPAPTIHQDLDGFKTRAQQQIAGHIAGNNPMIGHFLASNPMAGPVSNDDLGTLDAVSEHASALGSRGIWQRITDGYHAAKDTLSETINSPEYHEEESAVYNYIDSPVWKGFARNLIAAGGALNLAAAAPGAVAKGITTAAGDLYPGFEGDFNTLMTMSAGPQALMHGTLKASPEAFHQAVESASLKAKSIADPYLREGRPPPVGVDPVLDSAHLQQNQSDLVALNEALKQSQTSTTRERAPGMYIDFIRQHTDRTIGVSHDAVRELYGDKVPTEGDGLLGFVPDLPSQLLRAAVTGNDIQIPIPEFLTHVDPSVVKKLEPDIRTREGGITQNEAEVLGQRHQDTPPPEDGAFAATYKAAGLGEELPQRQYQTVEEPVGDLSQPVRAGAAQGGGDLVFRNRDAERGVDVYHDMGQPEGLGEVQKELQRFAPDDLTRGSSLMVQGVLKHLGLEDTKTYSVYPDHPAIEGNLGYYHPNGKNVVLRHTDDYGQMLRTTNHEALHAAFYRAIEASPEIKSAIGDLRHEALSNDAFFPDMHVANDKYGTARYTEHYGLTNEHEFISEAFTNPKFQEFLSGIKATPELLDKLGLGELPRSKLASMWDAFLMVARKAFGLDLSSENLSLLDATMKVGDRLTAAAEKSRKGGKVEDILAQKLPSTPEEIDPNKRVSLGSLYRGTEGGATAEAARRRVTKRGDLGDGVYFTNDEKLAGSYGGGPKASLKDGTRVVHNLNAAELYPEEVGYLYGGRKQGENVQLYSGNGIKLWEGPWDVDKLEQVLKEDGGIKAVIGTPDSIAANQISVRDPAVLRDKPADVLAQPVDPILERAKALGMNQSQAIRYRELINARDVEAFEKQKAKIAADERKRQTAEWQKNKAEVRKDVVRDIPQRPDIHADTLLRAGEKLDTDALTADQRKVLGDDHTRNGINPDDLAQHTGFDTGDEMIEAIKKLREERGETRPEQYIRDQIATETDRRMEEKYGNLDKNVIEAAKEQVLSKAQLDILHAEAQAAAGGELTFTQDQLKANVKKVVGELKLREINSDSAIAAAGRAGRAIEDGLLKNDPRAAFEQRMRQYNALLGAKEMARIEKAKARFEKTMKTYSKREVPGASQEYVNQIHGLMLKLGQGVKRSVQDIADSVAKDGHKSFDDFVNTKEGIGGDPQYRQDLNIPDFLRDPGFATNLNDLTADQFAQVDRAIKSLVFNARNESKVIRAGEKVDYVDARNDLLTQLKEVLPGSHKPLSLDNPKTTGKLAKSYWWSSINLETMLNRFDRDDPLGKFNQTLVRMYTEAAGDRERMLIDYNRKVRNLGHFGDMDKRVANDLFRDPESGQAYEMKRRHVLGVLQNVGNESNMRKLTQGYGISAPDVMEFLRKNTTKEDWDRAQKIGDLFGELFGLADNMSHNVSGVGIEKIDLAELTSPHGDKYAGWYNPVAYDKLRGEKTGRPGSIDDLEGGFYKATTPQTYTKTRTGYIGQMQLNLDIVPVRMKQMIHDITTREAVQQLGKFFYDPKFKNAIRDHYGAAQADSLEPFLRDFANAPNFESTAERAQNQLVGAMASNMVTTAIGLNPGTVLKHGLGALGKSLLQQPVGFTKALATVLGRDEKTGNTNWTRALELSDECKRRMRNFEDTVTNAGQTISLRGAGEGSHWKSVRAFSQYVGGYPIGAFDMLSSVPTFLASYDRAIAEGRDVGQAKFLADRDVRTTHGSSILTNRPEIARSRSAIGRTFAGFYGVFSENLQKQYQTAWMLKDAYGMAREGDFDMLRKSIPKLAGVAFTSTIMMALVEHAVDSNDETHKESWGQMAADLLTKSATSSLIGIRDMANAFTSERDPGGNLLSSFEKSIIDPAKDVRKAILKRDMKEIWGPQKAGAFLKRTAIMTGALTGVGNAQLGRVAQFLYNERKEHPRSGRDVAVGLWHGTLKNHRKGLLE